MDVECAHQNRLTEAILMSTLNIYHCFIEDKKDIIKLSRCVLWPRIVINP